MTVANSTLGLKAAGATAAVCLLISMVAGTTFLSSARAAEEGRPDPPAASTSGGCGGGLLLPPTQPPSPQPAEAGLLARVNFQIQGGHVVLPVRVNGSRTLEMVLDTGMSSPIVLLARPQIAEELGLKEGEPTLIGGAGGQEPRQGSVFPGASVSIGGLELTDQTLVTLSECGSPSPCIQDGVIGKSIFDRHAVEIDFESSTLSIHQGAVADTQGFVSLPLDLTTGIPAVAAEVELEDGRKIPSTLVLDLGARHALSMFFNEEKGIVAPRRTLAAVVGRGMQGEVSGKVGRLRGLHLGQFAFRDVVSSFTDPRDFAACSSKRRPTDGNLGIEILSRFRVIFDYPRGRLLLRPNSRFEDPFEYNMAGLSLDPQRDGSFLVRGVAAGSPGEEAGIARGDLIVGIDDQELTGSSLDENARKFRREGSSLKVEVEREGARFDRTLRLRRLI